MDRRTIIATLLMILIYAGYLYFFGGTEQPPAPSKRGVPLPREEKTGPPRLKKTGLRPPPRGFLPTARLGLKERELLVETDLVMVTLSSRGGTVKSWQLKNYIGPDGRPVDLVAPGTPLYPLRSWAEEEGEASELYIVEGEGLRLVSPGEKGTVAFTYITPSGLKIKKSMVFYQGGYRATVRLEVRNLGAEERTTTPRLVWGSGFRHSQDEKAATPKGLTTWADDKRITDDLEKIQGTVTHGGTVAWTAIHDNYFAAVLIPQGQGASAFVSKDQRGQPSAGLAGRLRQLGRAEESFEEFLIYAGPKELDRLQGIGQNLEQLVDLGWFDFLARPALYILKFLYRYTRNYGLAIIVLTVFIKVLFHPLTHKSLKSMQEMQTLQPKIAALREKYRNNPQKLNQETMELYRRHNVNPFGGCLPLVLQIPIFIALYNALSSAVELWRAPFVFWIRDLSAKDPYYILPILMGVSMFVQQKMTPTAGDPRQAQMMLLMPIIFTFMFLNFPSGLVLYWLVNNVLGIGQQYWINKRVALKTG